MKRVSYSLMICAAIAVSMGVVACGHESGKKSKVRTTGQKPTDTKSVFKYALKGVTNDETKTACEIPEKSFETLQALCEGLQKKNLNDNCALEERQTEFKKRKCEGEFTAVEDDVKPAPETDKNGDKDENEADLSEIKDDKTMKPGDAGQVSVVSVTEGADSGKAERLQIACAESYAKAVENKSVVSVIAGGNAILVRNAKDTAAIEKMLELKCEAGGPIESRFALPTLNEGVEEKKLVVNGESSLEVTTQKVKLNIHCHANAMNALKETEGLILLEGTSLVVWDETKAPVQIVTCQPDASKRSSH